MTAAHILRKLAAPLTWSAYIGYPAAGWGWLDGIPMGSVEAAALVLVWWLWVVTRRLPGARVLGALFVAKLALGGILVDHGFAARYYTNDSLTPPFAKSIEFRRDDITRVDERLAFGTEREPDLPLHFFNDLDFNFWRPTEPQRGQLPYSVEWSGFFRADASTSTFYLDVADGISADLVVDGRPVLAVEGGGRESNSVAHETGWRAVAVRARAPYGSGRAIEAGQVVGGVARPFDGSRVFVEPLGAVRLGVDRILRWITRLIDAGALLWLALLVATGVRSAWHEAAFLSLLSLGAIIEALLFAHPYAGRMTLLTGADDWLMYETYARDIALGDVLQLGLGGPYYNQPLYPYVIALTHLGFGDGLFGIILVQRLLLPAAVGWVAAMTWRLFGPRPGWIALVGGGAFLYAKVGPWTDVLLSELVFLPLVAGWIAMLVRTAYQGGTRMSAAATGALGGVATLIRSTLLLAWAPVTVLWWLSLRAHRGRLVAFLLVTMAAVVSTAGIRNWLVADRFALTATNFGITLFMGNEPTGPLEPAPPARARAYDRLGLPEPVRTVAEFAFQAPADFMRGLVNKAAYTVGFFRWSRLPGGETMRTSWLYVGMWVLAMAGVIRILWESLSCAVVWLPAAAAMSHFTVMVLMLPFGYTDRYILPLYPLLIPYAAFAAEGLARSAQQIPRVSIRYAAPGMNRLVRLARVTMQGLQEFGLASAAASIRLAARVDWRRPRTWLYISYCAALLARLVWRPEGPGPTVTTQGLLLPLVVVAVARLARKEAVHRAAGGVLFVAALLAIALGRSLSPYAAYDPLFWGLLAVVAAGLSAVTGRWTVVAMTTASLAGALTMVGILLPFSWGVDVDGARASFDALRQHAGTFGAICLLGLWGQAIAAGLRNAAAGGRVFAAAGGALVAAFALGLTGAWPTDGATLPGIVILGVLLGLVEARTGDRGAGGGRRAT